jgi:endoglucanase
MVPVHRLRKGAVHRFVTEQTELSRLKRSGWIYEHVAFYAAARTSNRPFPGDAVNSGAESQKDDGPSATSGTGVGSKTPGRSAAATAKFSEAPFGQQFYLNKYSAAWAAYAKESDLTKKQLLYQIAGTPSGIWFSGKSTDAARLSDIMAQSRKRHLTPQVVLYAIPHRDCGSYSAGGLNTVKEYKAWIDSMRAALSGGPAIVILEPDAIGMSCLTNSQQNDRYSMLQYAMKHLSSKTVFVYIHAGSSGLSVKSIAAALKKAGVGSARGFAVNVSGFDRTASEINYGTSILKTLGMSKHFVIDTSRNGLGRYQGSNGGAPSWCNPPGRALGKRPTTKTGNAAVDAYLWVKPPGESDGQCHSGDPKGWFQAYALDISARSLEQKTIGKINMPSTSAGR